MTGNDIVQGDGGDDLLIRKADVFDNCHRRCRISAMHKQATLNKAGGFFAHVDRGNFALLG